MAALGVGVPFMLASLGLASSAAARQRVQRIGPVIQPVGGALWSCSVLLVSGAYDRLTSSLARFTPPGGL